MAKKTIIGFIQLIVGLGVLLFVPAGTMDFWQAWAYLSVFGTSVVLIFAYLYKHDPKLLERRLNRTEKEQSQKRIQLYIFITYIGTLVLPSMDHRFLWSDVPFKVVMAGDGLVALGYCLMFFVLKENTFAAATVEVVGGQKVISTGLYSVIRHPMYAGGIITLLGTPLALGSWWGLLMFIPSVIIIVWRLFDEENLLSQSLSGYKEYCHKVRYHLVPFIW
jgi:protein-S-isoprenylcysteine O-methyltransferase Ste14